MLSKKWFDTLPPDLQKIVHGQRRQGVRRTSIRSSMNSSTSSARIWMKQGRRVHSLPADEQTAMIAKVSSIGDDLSKSKPGLNEAIKVLSRSAKRNK